MQRMCERIHISDKPQQNKKGAPCGKGRLVGVGAVESVLLINLFKMANVAMACFSFASSARSQKLYCDSKNKKKRGFAYPLSASAGSQPASNESIIM